MVLGLLLAGLIPSAARAEFCNLVYRFEDISRIGVYTTSAENVNPTVVLHIVHRGPIAEFPGHAPCTIPGVEDWPAGIRWLYVEVKPNDLGGIAALSRCEKFAILVQNDPQKYALEVVFTVTPGDQGNPVVNTNTGVAWAYKVTFDGTSFISCALSSVAPV